ncbi:hypothetical protein TRFO_02365 [Tritrichomonas foetus]|uniref:CCR4-NOT transcription complex subunit 11 n=1 Tax=Tritrichomonas foetus TaxID=1144522 RepID=A0A1J4J840_9EUKA|nr:hypothetical protein TRFO_02365 [Tritrichomonas foetus]|eukprot:OHS93843.1 hypothetical protein TRFO_02365 [Tritrichomonas foetus]
MLSREAAKRTVSLISNMKDPVSTIHSRFSTEFSFEERVSILTCLSVLLSEAMLDHHQQIAAAWLIYSEFDDSPLNENPYAFTFSYINQIYIHNPNQFCPSLCDLIPIILSDTSLDFLRTLTIPQILHGAFSAPNSTPKTNMKEIPEVEQLPRFLVERVETDSELSNDDVLIELLTSDVLLTPFEPIFPRSPPEVMPICEAELQYISWPDNPPFFFDQNIVLNSKEAAIVLLTRATEEKLNPSEIESVLNAMKKFPTVIEATSFENSKLKTLIDLNTDIAKEYVSKSIDSRRDLIQFVTSLGISVATVEVVKHLILNQNVDDDFVQNYVVQSITAIQKIKDQQSQRVKVMFFCRFMTFLKSNNIQFNRDVLIELHSFCYDFSKKGISEAQELFQML